eukprot:SAG11_NODE_2336_length_3502_cov_6.183368_3_plen_76_part_00
MILYVVLSLFGAGSASTEVILDHCLEGFSKQPMGCNEYGDECVGGCGALKPLIVDSDLKLIKGSNFVRLLNVAHD